MKACTKLFFSLVGIFLFQTGFLASSQAGVFFFQNNSGITINDNAAATPYPSTINVAGVTGAITRVTVGIVGMSHTWANDVDIHISAPNDQNVTLISDAWGSADFSNTTLVFNDCALRAPTINFNTIASGRYRPTNFFSDAIIGPAPDDPASTLAVFNGLSGANVNGTWNLWVSDDVGIAAGTIASWNITIYTDEAGLPAGLNPVPCGKPDFDGDGRADTVVYQQATGHWFAVGSANGFFNVALSFGGPGYVNVAGDYDGDGITDAAVYHTTNGNWFAVGSTAGFMNVALAFGGTGYTPMPGDYDGDGQTDPAVYQASTGHWFIVGSTDGFSSQLGFGGAGFVPVPAAQ